MFLTTPGIPLVREGQAFPEGLSHKIYPMPEGAGTYEKYCMRHRNHLAFLDIWTDEQDRPTRIEILHVVIDEKGAATGDGAKGAVLYVKDEPAT